MQVIYFFLPSYARQEKEEDGEEDCPPRFQDEEGHAQEEALKEAFMASGNTR